MRADRPYSRSCMRLETSLSGATTRSTREGRDLETRAIEITYGRGLFRSSQQRPSSPPTRHRRSMRSSWRRQFPRDCTYCLSVPKGLRERNGGVTTSGRHHHSCVDGVAYQSVATATEGARSAAPITCGGLLALLHTCAKATAHLCQLDAIASKAPHSLSTASPSRCWQSFHRQIVSSALIELIWTYLRYSERS